MSRARFADGTCQLSAANRPRRATYQSQEEALDVGVGQAVRADGGSGDGHEGHREEHFGNAHGGVARNSARVASVFVAFGPTKVVSGLRKVAPTSSEAVSRQNTADDRSFEGLSSPTPNRLDQPDGAREIRVLSRKAIKGPEGNRGSQTRIQIFDRRMAAMRR